MRSLSLLKRIFIFFTCFLLGVILLSPISGQAAPKIAIITGSGSKPYTDVLTGLQNKVDQAGRHVEYEIFQFGDDPDLVQTTLDNLKQNPPEAIVTLGSQTFIDVSDSIKNVPIVASMLLDMSKIMEHSNATGVGIDIPVIQQFAWLKKFFPKIENLGVLYSPEQNKEIIEEAKGLAVKSGFNLVSQQVLSPKDIPGALLNLTGKIDVLWAVNDTVVANQKTVKNLLLFSFRNKIPFIGLSSAWVKAGAFYALDRDYSDIGVQCGEIVLKILDGTDPAAIAPAFPRTITFSVNKRTAAYLHIEIPQEFIDRAANVY